MKSRNEIIAQFMEIAMSYQGAAPEFKLTNKGVCVTSAPSGFIKLLANNPRICMSLSKEGLEVEFFQD